MKDVQKVTTPIMPELATATGEAVPKTNWRFHLAHNILSPQQRATIVILIPGLIYGAAHLAGYGIGSMVTAFVLVLTLWNVTGIAGNPGNPPPARLPLAAYRKLTAMVTLAFIAYLAHQVAPSPPPGFWADRYLAATSLSAQLCVLAMVASIAAQQTGNRVVHGHPVNKAAILFHASKILLVYHGVLALICFKSNGYSVAGLLAGLGEGRMGTTDIMTLAGVAVASGYAIKELFKPSGDR